MARTSYILMNKNKAVMSFCIMEEGQLSSYQDITALGTLPLDMKNIDSWIRDRFVIMERNRSESLMSSLGLVDDRSRIEFTNCASLFDSFWVKRADSMLTWKDVSLYRNDFSEYLSRFTMNETIDVNAPKRIRHLSPEYHSEGSFDRCWVWSSKGICLLKAGSHGYANAGREPFSEVYVNQLEKALGYSDYVEYSLLWYPRRIAGTKSMVNSVVTSCPAMTDEEIGLISASRLGITSYEELLDYCEAISGEEREKAIDMLLLDCLTLNIDRHLGNVSMFVENDTQKVLGLSKIYDNNMALVPYYMPEYDGSLAEYAGHLVTKLGMEFDELFCLCYGHSNRKPEIRKKLRYIVSDFAFHELNEVQFVIQDDKLFPMSRLNELTKLVKAQAEHYLGIAKMGIMTSDRMRSVRLG